jgi:zinc protease
VPANAPFALRAAIYQVDRIVRDGISAEAFKSTRDFLVSYSKLWARSQSDRLGFHMDSRFYGMPYFIDHVESQLAGLGHDEVNRAIRKYIQTSNFAAVLISGEGNALAKRLRQPDSSITYENPVPADVLKVDETIRHLPLRPEAIHVVPVGQLFEGGK